MALTSNLFAGDARLEACAVNHPDHVTPGAKGPHVRKIQGAVMALDGAVIDQRELDAAQYGPSTAQAVLAYKTTRDIVNRSYQSKADNIVGIMTIKALDDELVSRQIEMKPAAGVTCPRHGPRRPRDSTSLLAADMARATQQTRRPEVAAAVRAGKPGIGRPAS